MTSHSYFPYRAHKNRPYISEFLERPLEDRDWAGLVQMALFRTRDSFGDRETVKADKELGQIAYACGMNESWLATSIAAFFAGGQVVFHISPTLKAAFQHSDLGDATARDLKLPFEQSYIHLGADSDLVFNGGRTVLEGVFLERNDHESGASLSLTLVGTLLTPPQHWGERGMETFTFHFTSEEMDLPILDGAKKHLERHGRPLNAQDIEDDKFDADAKQSILDSWASQEEKRRLYLINIPVVLACVRMVANALLYVSQYPDDMVDDYQDDFPIGFKEKIERSQGKALERNLSKARNSGFTVIKRVGSVFEQAMQSEGSDGESPSPHMRRAHWRRQAHGVGKSQRKLIWIRASRVLGGDVRDRAYLVSSDSAKLG